MLNSMLYSSSLLTITVLFLTAGNALAAVIKNIHDAAPPNSSELLVQNLDNVLTANSNSEENQFSEIINAEKAQPIPDIANTKFNARNKSQSDFQSSSDILATQLNEVFTNNLEQSQPGLFPYNSPEMNDGSSLTKDLQVPINSFNKVIAQVPEAVPEKQPQKKKNFVGVSFGTTILPIYGINAKIEVFDNVSVRPFIQYGKVPESLLRVGDNAITNISGFVYGVSATYDFNVDKSDLIPYAGIGVANASGSVSSSSPVARSQSSFTSPIFVEIGADYNFTDSITINANYKFQDLGFLSFGAGYRF